MPGKHHLIGHSSDKELWQSLSATLYGAQLRLEDGNTRRREVEALKTAQLIVDELRARDAVMQLEGLR